MCKQMEQHQKFNSKQIETINSAAEMAEELVSNFYKMSTSQWLQRRYDIKTLTDLSPDEIVDGPFAQIIRYEGHHQDRPLGSSAYDFYKICLQDHAIQAALRQQPGIKLFAFVLYIVTHELIHIVRFSKFLQYFDVDPEERMAEEKRVHAKTHEILKSVSAPGLAEVLTFYNEWRMPYDGVRDP